MKKKILFLIPFFVVLLSINNVNAQTYVNIDLYSNLIMPRNVQFYGWSDDTNYYALQTSCSTEQETNQFCYAGATGGEPFYNDANGFSIYFDLPESLPVNTKVGIDLIFCNTTTNNYFNGGRTYGIGTALGSTITDNLTPTSSLWYSLGSYNTDIFNFSSCRRFSNVFTTSSTATKFAYRIRSTSNVDFGLMAFMGMTFTNYGIDYSTNFEDLEEGIGNMTEQQEITNDKLDDLNNAITDESAPNKLGNLSDSAGWLPAGPVDSILNLPLTMFQNLSNNIGSTCTPLVINLPYVNEDITLPCLNSIYEEIDGLSVWINSIGVIASAFILYSYLLTLYKWVDDTLTFRENNHIDNWGGI